MKKLLKRIALCPSVSKRIVSILARVHQRSYRYMGEFATAAEGGLHPKHRIMKYKEWFLDHIEPGWVVIDVGCNTGLMPELLSQKAMFVYGVEIEERLVMEAKSKRQKPNVEYICADATKYDFSGKTVDCVTLSNVIEHIEDRVGFLKAIIKNLRWNGDKRILIRVPMIDREWLVIYKKELGIDYRLDPTHFTEYTLEQLMDELSRAGIEIIEHSVKFGEIYASCMARLS